MKKIVFLASTLFFLIGINELSASNRNMTDDGDLKGRPSRVQMTEDSKGKKLTKAERRAAWEKQQLASKKTAEEKRGRSKSPKSKSPPAAVSKTASSPKVQSNAYVSGDEDEETSVNGSKDGWPSLDEAAIALKKKSSRSPSRERTEASDDEAEDKPNNSPLPSNQGEKEKVDEEGEEVEGTVLESDLGGVKSNSHLLGVEKGDHGKEDGDNDIEKKESSVSSSPSVVKKSTGQMTELESADARKAELSKAIAARVKTSESQGWISSICYGTVNVTTRLFTSSQTRYQEGTWPSLTFGDMLSLFRSTWFAGKKEAELLSITVSQCLYKLRPIVYDPAVNRSMLSKLVNMTRASKLDSFLPRGLEFGKYTIHVRDAILKRTLIARDLSQDEINEAIFDSYNQLVFVTQDKDSLEKFGITTSATQLDLCPYQFLQQFIKSLPSVKKYVRNQFSEFCAEKKKVPIEDVIEELLQLKKLTMKDLESVARNEPFLLDLNFSRRPDHNKHTNTILYITILAYSEKLGHALFFRMPGYRIHQEIKEGEIGAFQEQYKAYDLDDFAGGN